MSKLITRSSSIPMLVALSFATVALPASLRGQAAPAPRSSVEVVQAVGPRVLPMATWGMETSAPAIDVPAPQSRPHAGKDVAMMVAGGAAVVVGLLVGGDAGAVVAIGGGAVAIVGLYHYMR